MLFLLPFSTETFVLDINFSKALIRSSVNKLFSTVEWSPIDKRKNGGSFSAIAEAADRRDVENPKLTPLVKAIF
jgi:hypothetical protein